MTSEKPGMSTGKKWLIGCGGCLGVLVVLSIVVVVALQMGWNALQGTSQSSIEAIFGPNYQTEEYIAFGIPINQKDIKHVVMLIDKKNRHMFFATETILSERDANLLKEGNRLQLEAFLKNLSKQATQDKQQSASQLQQIQFNKLETARLKNGKTVSVSHATLGLNQGESLKYSPAVIALVPKPEKHLVVLVGMDPNSTSPDAQASFEYSQQALQDNLIYMIEDSVLDDQLVSNTKAVSTKAGPKP